MMKKIILVCCFLLLFSGCQSTLRTQSHIEESHERADSVHVTEKSSISKVSVLPSTVSIELGLNQIDSLPIGANYMSKQDQATVTVRKTGEHEFKITADCDSLTLLVAQQSREIYRYKQENDAIKLSKVDVIEVYRQTKIQIVLCWLGGIFVALIIGVFILLLFKFGKYIV